jgi:serine/threonine-protein kinase
MDDRLLAGRYRLLEPLGRGGMGQVRRAWDSSLGRPVAIKLLELDDADPAAAERFRREAQTTARLSHPNIVTVFDTGTDGNTAFLVMELLPGPSLQDRLTREGPLPIADAAAIGAHAAAALAAAHAAGVVHRDIKPANIVYNGPGQIKVLDFGIARLIETTTALTRLTQTATVIGTAAYLSPEQASGAPVGPQTDLYALGCVLFALLTGTPPFTGETPLQVCSQHLHAPPPDVAALRPGCPPRLTALISELLSKDPAARPLGAAAVRDRLTSAADPEAATTPTPQPPPTVSPSYQTKVLRAPAKLADRVRSWPRRWVAAAAAAAVLAAVLAIALGDGGQTGHSPTTAQASQKQGALPPQITARHPAAKRLTPQQAITAFSTAVTRAEAVGGIALPAAQDLLNRMTDLQNTLVNGHPSDASHKIADLNHHLGDLEHSGQLTTTGQRLLAAPLAALERAIPPQSGPPGPAGHPPP